MSLHDTSDSIEISYVKSYQQHQHIHGVFNIIGGSKYDTFAACKLKAKIIGFHRQIFQFALVHHILYQDLYQFDSKRH